MGSGYIEGLDMDDLPLKMAERHSMDQETSLVPTSGANFVLSKFELPKAILGSVRNALVGAKM